MTPRPASITVSAELLDQGRRLLDEQRQAMIDGDADRLLAGNARLAQWLASVPRGAQVPAELLTALKSAAQVNAQTAARAATRNRQALDALLPAAAFTYDAAGLGRSTGPAGRRSAQA